MQDKIVFSLSLAKKAGALVQGFDAVKESVYKYKAHLVLYTSDMSDKNKLRIQRFCSGIVEVMELPLLKDELLSITRKETGVFALTNKDIAKLCTNALSLNLKGGLSAEIKEENE